MSRGLYAVLALALLSSHCTREAGNTKAAREESAGAVSTSADADAPTVTQSFPESGITTVVLRAGDASRATIHHTPHGKIEISGKARGGAPGYHSPDPNWRETPAAKWGLDFVAKQYENVLVISTKNEIRYIHHSYYLDTLVLSVPIDVKVVPEKREPSENGAPDLSPPK